MRMFCISGDADSHAGMRLAGVEGTMAHTREELAAGLEGLSDDIGIVVVTRGLAEGFPEEIRAFRARTRPLPLLVTL